MERCQWVTKDEIYIDYHDKEWGVPLWDEAKLFEMLLLEGAQAGLSWLTVLKKRENYRQAFDGFQPEKMAEYDDDKLMLLAGDPGIIRNRRKILAMRNNARAYMGLKEQGTSFSQFLWRFVDGRPRMNCWESHDRVPTVTVEAEQMSQALRKAGFSFVGPTICYAFMQAVGMVNDHTVSCFRHREIILKWGGEG